MAFAGLNLGTLQEVLYPLINSLTGVDPGQYIKEGGRAFHTAADELRFIADYVEMCAVALEDGILSNEELDGITKRAGTMAEAVQRVSEAFRQIDGKPDVE